MPNQPRKLSFQEAVDSCVPFYNDESLEQRFDKFIDDRLSEIVQYKGAGVTEEVTEKNVVDFMRNEPRGLLRILGQLRLSEEKFRRIVTLLRKLHGTFDREWTINRIERSIRQDDEFARRLADLFINGSNDPVLVKHLPRFYRERLNLRHFAEGIPRIGLKDRYMGTYSNWKGDLVEGFIKNELKRIEQIYGVGFAAGSTPLVNVTVDWAIPNLDDPYVIVMSSYQETTSSGQTVKARDMISCYQAITDRNVRHLEDRAFVNFVDGGGWLARYRDFRRLVAACHYFLNMANLAMLESIVIQHVPRKYFTRQQPPTLT